MNLVQVFDLTHELLSKLVYLLLLLLDLSELLRCPGAVLEVTPRRRGSCPSQEEEEEEQEEEEEEDEHEL